MNDHVMDTLFIDSERKNGSNGEFGLKFCKYFQINILQKRLH